jgi:hypothetical protein
MSRLKSSINLDKIGISASVICAIHCAFVPVLMTMLPLVGIGFLAKSGVESIMIVLSILIAGISLGSSYKLHQKHLPLVLLMIGVILIAIGHLFLPENLERFILPIGGLTVAAAHYFNWDFSSKCSVNHSHVTPIR